MEDGKQAIIVSITENSLVKPHCLLFVTTEEVDLDTFYADLLHPAHIPFAGNRIAHHIDRTLHYIVPPSARAVPQEYIHILRSGIADKFFSSVITKILIPSGIHEDMVKTQLSSKIHICLLISHIHACILPYDPAPCGFSILIIMLCLVQRLHHIPCDCRLHYRL